MRKSFFFFLIAVLALPCNISAREIGSTRWAGIYDFTGAGGREAGGIAVFPTITLILLPSGKCEIRREGYQMLDSIVCSVAEKTDGIDVLFKSYPGGKMTNEYGFTVYRPGQRLFSLIQKQQSSELITDWGALKPKDYVGGANRGTYFKRVKK